MRLMRCRIAVLPFVASFVLLLPLLGGCSTTREFTITADPPDALISVDGIEVAQGPVVQEIVFRGAEDTHTVSADRLGFKEQTVELTRDYPGDTINIDLNPLTRVIHFQVGPVPALVTINGEPVDDGLVTGGSRELEFTVDAQNRWTTHTLRAERPGWAPVERVIAWQDQTNAYELALQPLRKDVVITSEPEGATVFLGGEEVGLTPLTISDHPFPVDVQTGEFIPQQLRLTKPGYDPLETTISWDGGDSEYVVQLPPKSKTVEIVTDPPAAVVTIEGTELPRNSAGVSVADLTFTPVDEQGTLRTYTATVSKKTEDTEWAPKDIVIGWDEGQERYTVTLREILTTPVPMIEPQMVRTDDGWQVEPKRTTTLAMKDVTEGPNKPPPTQLTRLPAGSMLDHVAVSPDGTKLVFTILDANQATGFRSQLMVMQTDGVGGAAMFGDGRSLDITPSFTAGGDQIVFSSNRGGRNLAVWSMSATGAPGITQLTTGDTNDLWPTVDSDPKPRLYYQAFVDTRPDPRLYMTQLGTTIRTDLTHIGGSQPRVSPRADAVLFTAVNSMTGKRDIYRMSDRGGEPQNITNTPDIDEFDPTWNRDGSKVAFAADRASDPETGRNYDIWMIDLAAPDQPVQLTVNGSWDDSPAFDPTGNAVYFRSNRGGEWNIWQVPTP